MSKVISDVISLLTLTYGFLIFGNLFFGTINEIFGTDFSSEFFAGFMVASYYKTFAQVIHKNIFK